MTHNITCQHVKLDERNLVQKQLLNQLIGEVRVTPLFTEAQEAGV